MKKLIEDLEEQIKELEPVEMNECSWFYDEGVLITGNQAKQIVGILEKQKQLEDEITRLQQKYDENGYACTSLIKLERIEQHVDAELKILYALQGAGVDDWEGYEFAMEDLNES